MSAQVFPTAVGEEDGDVAAVHPLADAHRAREGGARGDAGEDAFAPEQLLGEPDAVLARDHDFTVEERGIEDRRDESLIHVAQALDQIAQIWLTRDHLDPLVVLLET